MTKDRAIELILLTVIMTAVLLLFVPAHAAPAKTRTYTLTDLRDVDANRRCLHRGYAYGWSLPNGGYRCADDFSADADMPFTLPNNMQGRALIVTPPTHFYRE
jgi:hypothetical protein